MAEFVLTIDVVRKLITTTICGFPAPDTIIEIGAETRRTVRALGWTVGRHALLWDMSEASVAPQSSVAALHELLTNPAYHRLRARRIAFVTPSALLKMQIALVCKFRSGMSVFNTRAEAEHWLFAEPDHDDEIAPRTPLAQRSRMQLTVSANP